jgi:hypothetical protein
MEVGMEKITTKDVIVTKGEFGGYRCSCMFQGYRRSILYFFCSKREAISRFVYEINNCKR